MTRFGQPYWWDGQAQTPLDPLAPLPDDCDLLIIGAGYTGLSAAITARGLGATVCVVDSQHPGYGASSRNGGMVGAHPRQSLASLAKQVGQDTANQIFNEAALAFSYFKSLIETHKIDCDYQTTGRIQLAWTAADFAAQTRMAADMNNKTDFKTILLSRDQLGEHIRTDHYFGALYYPDHGALQPYKFVQGLLKAALDLGANIVGNCTVGTIKREGSSFIAHSTKGAIRAKKIIYASNGYTDAKIGAILAGAARLSPAQLFNCNRSFAP